MLLRTYDSTFTTLPSKINLFPFILGIQFVIYWACEYRSSYSVTVACIVSNLLQKLYYWTRTWNGKLLFWLSHKKYARIGGHCRGEGWSWSQIALRRVTGFLFSETIFHVHFLAFTLLKVLYVLHLVCLFEN